MGDPLGGTQQVPQKTLKKPGHVDLWQFPDHPEALKSFLPHVEVAKFGSLKLHDCQTAKVGPEILLQRTSSVASVSPRNPDLEIERSSPTKLARQLHLFL